MMSTRRIRKSREMPPGRSVGCRETRKSAKNGFASGFARAGWGLCGGGRRFANLRPTGQGLVQSKADCYHNPTDAGASEGAENYQKEQV